jgi:hypothetical protein
MYAVFMCGVSIAELQPVSGFTGANGCTHSYSVCFTAAGREPRWAQTWVSVPCCPIRASSWNHT